ncbi:MAG: T9SS type A sorting domain-containing protein [Prevotella sp.]|nr:T9SS type A sorting domain-containing protein [Prevotella sp.]
MKTTNILKWVGFLLLPFITSLAATAKSPELVDLGLSVKWADMNIDASTVTDFGGYYAWGETVMKSTYTWANYSFCSGTETTCQFLCDDISRNISYDRAYNCNPTLWLPTVGQWEELFSKCTWKEATVNGVKGYNVTGPNGSTIFLPFSGCSYEGSVHDVGSSAYYWSANNVSDDNSKGQAAYIKSGSKAKVSIIRRRTGAAIRAVGALTTVELVDLGLSVKWANKNIDADKESDTGGYYAWGETDTKDTYTWANYEYCSGTEESCVVIGSDIRKNRKYDRAYNYSTNLCLPTNEQWEELISKCTWKSATVDGVKGYRITGQNGNTIFLPFSGCSYEGGSHDVGKSAYYWTSNYAMGENFRAQAAYVKSGSSTTVSKIRRRTGAAIRAVEVAFEEDHNWYLVTDNNEFFEMSRVGMLVATDDEAFFSVLDKNGEILADEVLQVRFLTGNPTSIKEIKIEGQSNNMLKGLVNNRLTLVGAKGTIDIYSTSGIKVVTTKATGEETTIDVASLSSGVYVVKCGKQSFKFNKK